MFDIYLVSYDSFTASWQGNHGQAFIYITLRVSVKSAYVHTVWNVGIYDIYPVSLMKVSRLQLLTT